MGAYVLEYIENYYKQLHYQKIELDAKYEVKGFYEKCGIRFARIALWKPVSSILQWKNCCIHNNGKFMNNSQKIAKSILTKMVTRCII